MGGVTYSFLLFPELELEYQLSDSLDTDDFEDLKEGNGLEEWNVLAQWLVWDRRQQIYYEVTTDVSAGNPSSLAHILT